MSDITPVPAIREKSLDLLARAALAPEAEAISAWRAWRKDYDIDNTPWSEVRMLGAVAARIETLEPDASIRPRVLGIRKFLWVHSQMCLNKAISGLAALNNAGIPALLMKGAARIARDPASAQERLIRDVDVLVPLGREQHAFDVLQNDGWALVAEEWQINFRRLAPVAGHHAWSLAKDKFEIDLHHFSNHLNRLRGDDDRVWARSVPVAWHGVNVRVPSPADALLIALIHGVRWSKDGSADWAVDASALIDEGNLDWDVFLEEATDRKLQAVLSVGLVYLRNTLHKPVPDEVIRRLRVESTSAQQAELEQYTSTPSPDTPQHIFAASLMAIQRALSHNKEIAGGAVQKLPQKVAARYSINLPSGESCAFKLPQQHGKYGWLIVQATIDWPHPQSADPIMVEFIAPGLPLAKLAGKLHPNSAQSFAIKLPEILLDFRGIRVLAFKYWTESPSTSLSVTITLSRSEWGQS